MVKTLKQGIAFLLALTLGLTLCACAVNPRDLLGMLDASQPTSSQRANPQPEIPENAGGSAPSRAAGRNPSAPAGIPAHNGPMENAPPQSTQTAEGQQSLALLRERNNFPDVMFSVAYLGYVGGLFEEGFEVGFPQWLRETNPAMLEQYPFLAEIGPDHILGGAGHLYCIVPQDENATLAINRVQWDETTQTGQVTRVLYRSETGEPVLLFANLDDITSRIDTEIHVTDNHGNTCTWHPALDAQGVILPCITAAGIYRSADFTEYGWQTTPSSLAPWFAAGYTGMTAQGFAGSETEGLQWTIESTARETDRRAYFSLWVSIFDNISGRAELCWNYTDNQNFEEIWNGSWMIQMVPNGPTYLTLELTLVGGERYNEADDPVYLCETYPLLISPSGTELVVGAGESGICLPFMSQSTLPYVLTLAEG